MNKTDYENRKSDFKHLTGKNADDNLDAFFNYLVMFSNIDVKMYLREIRLDVNTLMKRV